MTTNTTRFDVARYLVDEDTMAHYLSDCFDEGGDALFLQAVGDVARARGMSGVANDSGLTRASLYKALGEGGNPALDTVARVLDTLGFRFAIQPKQAAAKPARVRKVAKATGPVKKAATKRNASRRPSRPRA
jgi:probable addiction module antidote protein